MFAGLAACGDSSSGRKRNAVLEVSCAAGGPCEIGDIGPGGGIVFIDPQTDGNTKDDYYMEAAPLNGFAPWGCAEGIGDGRAIGDGELNTLTISEACKDPDAMTAVSLVDELDFNGRTDWFLPSEAELIALYENKDLFTCPSSGLCSSSFSADAYWSSSVDATNKPLALNFASDDSTSVATEAVNSIGVRPVRAFSTLPGAPTDVAGTVGDKEVALTWTAPANEGAAITDYVVKSCSGDVCVPFAHVASTATLMTVLGLTNGVAYTFQIAAVNAAGTGGVVTSGSFTPRTVPDAPTGVQALADNTGGVDVSWTAPQFDGGVVLSDYVIEYAAKEVGEPANDDFEVFADSTSTETSVKVTGLTKSSLYAFRVAAKNIAGQGEYSSPIATATPRTVPDAPTGTVAYTRDGAVELQWGFVAPSTDGGSEIVEYSVEWALNSSSSWTNSGKFDSRTTRIEGLTAGKVYKFRATARNAAGTGPYSVPVTATPRVPPQSPTNLTYRLNNGEGTRLLQLMWDAPTDTGGAPLTEYQVSSCRGEVCTALPKVTPMKSVLPERTQAFTVEAGTYTFYVAAVNSAGRQICANENRCGVSVTIEISDGKR